VHHKRVTSLINHPTAMLGGLWGSKLNSPPEVRQKWKTAWSEGMEDELMWANRTEKGPDQRFLKKFVFPLLSVNVFQRKPRIAEYFDLFL